MLEAAQGERDRGAARRWRDHAAGELDRTYGITVHMVTEIQKRSEDCRRSAVRSRARRLQSAMVPKPVITQYTENVTAKAVGCRRKSPAWSGQGAEAIRAGKPWVILSQRKGARLRSSPSRSLGHRAVPVIGAVALAVAAAACTTAGPSDRGTPAAAVPTHASLSATSATGGATVAGTGSTMSTAGRLALPTIPWDGGSAYYSRFPKAAAYGWTRPHFFPITIWDAVIATRRDVIRDKAAGINTFLSPYVYDYPAIQAAHMSVIKALESRGSGPEVVGYDLADEPDGRLGLGSGPINRRTIDCSTSVPCAFTAMAYLDSLVPKNSGRFTFTNYTSEVITNPAKGARLLRNYQSVNSMDAYYYTSSGTGCYVARVYGLVTASECPKAADYGVDVAREQALDSRQPMFNFVELGTTNQAGDNITPGEIGGAVWNSIINGAMGINYFIEDTAPGPCGETDNVIEDTRCPDAVAATREVTKVDRQIQALAPVLNTQSYRHRFNARLDTMLKYYNGSYYIFAMLGLKGNPGSYAFTLPAGLSASRVQVIDENRTITINGSSFTDSFSKEYSYHIYKITP